MLADGDVIHVMYTTTGFGSDLGGSWYDSNTTLESLVVEGGDLTSTFVSGEAGGSYDYTLAIDDDSANIALTPTAANKNYLVRTYLNVKDTGAAEGSALLQENGIHPCYGGRRDLRRLRRTGMAQHEQSGDRGPRLHWYMVRAACYQPHRQRFRGEQPDHSPSR